MPGIERIQNEHFTPSNETHSEEQNSPSSVLGAQKSHSEEKLSTSEEEIAPSEWSNSPLNIQRLNTENTNIDHTHRTCARENFKNLEKMLVGDSGVDQPITSKSIADEMIHLWEQYVIQKLDPTQWQGVIERTEKRNSQLESLLAFHFQNDMRLWERFCVRIQSSNFMMGGGQNGWKVTLDWILDDRNLRKVLEGNYDNTSRSGLQESHDYSYLEKVQSNPVRDAEKAAIIDSIKDPVWKNWCAKLAEGVWLNEFRMLEAPLSLGELSDIANARFLECEDERLLWVGSEDPSVLNKIDNLSHKIKWVFAKEYPKARCFRTRLLEKNSPQKQECIHSQSFLPNPTQQQGDIHHA